MRGSWRHARTSTATLRLGCPADRNGASACHTVATWSPIASASSSIVGYNPHLTTPIGASSRVRNVGVDTTPSRNGSAIAFATARTRPLLRKLVPKRQHGRRLVGVRELLRESRKRALAGAAPPVDGLRWITDGSQQRRRADRGMQAAEQRAQEHQLRVAGVLVFVEQHRAEGAALAGRDLGELLGEVGRQRHLVGEVETFASPLRVAIRRNDRQQLASSRECAGDAGDVVMECFGAALRGRFRQRSEHCVDLLAERAHLFTADPMLGQTLRQVPAHRWSPCSA